MSKKIFITLTTIVILLAVSAVIGIYLIETEKISQPLPFFIPTQPAISKGKTYKLITEPSTTAQTTLNRYQPLVDYLNQETGLNIELIVAANQKDFLTVLKEKKADFTLQDAFSLYSIREQSVIYSPIAKPALIDGKTFYSGYIIVKADSNIKTLQDLKGKNILFGPKTYSTKFFAPYQSLKKAGIDPEKDLKYTNNGMCDNIATAVMIGDYDAGVICGLFIGTTEEFKFDGTDLRIIEVTNPVPFWLFSASDQTDAAAIGKVKQALLKLNKENPKTKEVLKVVKWSSFQEITGKELTTIGEMAKTYEVPLAE